MARLRKAVNNLRAKSHGYLTLSPRDDQPASSLEDQEDLFRAKILSCYELCLAYEDKEAQAEARKVVPLDDLKAKARAKYDSIADKRQALFLNRETHFSCLATLTGSCGCYRLVL